MVFHRSERLPIMRTIARILTCIAVALFAAGCATEDKTCTLKTAAPTKPLACAADPE
jgi:hypothetical protein